MSLCRFLGITNLDLRPVVAKSGVEIDKAQEATHRGEHTFPDMVSDNGLSAEPSIALALWLVHCKKIE